METKTKISIRLSNKLLEKVDALCQEKNKESKRVWYDGTYSYLRDGYTSRADVIEKALKQFFAPEEK